MGDTGCPVMSSLTLLLKTLSSAILGDLIAIQFYSNLVF